MPKIPDRYYLSRESRRPRPLSYVYCLVDSSFVMVKIGKHGKDPRAGGRTKGLQTGSAYRLYLLAFSTSLTERDTLLKYGGHNPRRGGKEWRRLTWELLQDIKRLRGWQWYDARVMTWCQASLLRAALSGEG